MKKLISLALALLMALTAFSCAFAEAENAKPVLEKYGAMGHLTKLNTTEEELNESLEDFIATEYYFDRFVFFDTITGMVMALKRGDIAIIDADENTAEYIASRNEHFVVRIPNDGLFQMSYAMLLREKDQELCDRISGAIREMAADGSIGALKKEYIDNVIAGDDPRAIEFQSFEGADTFVVAVTGDRPPMDYISANGVPMGFNTALIAKIAARLQLNVQLVSIDSGARAIALASGAADAVFWTEEVDYGNWDGSTNEDMPEGTIATESYLSCLDLFVVLDSSPLAEILEPWKQTGN